MPRDASAVYPPDWMITQLEQLRDSSPPETYTKAGACVTAILAHGPGSLPPANL
jgi:hypothetical protein